MQILFFKLNQKFHITFDAHVYSVSLDGLVMETNPSIKIKENKPTE